MTTPRSRAQHPTRTTQLALALFGWQWHDDWPCWCPPGSSSRDVIHPPSLEKLYALERHGAHAHGRAGTDDRGRSLIPDYRYDPEAADILWQWLHAQPGIRRIEFVPLPVPPDSLQGSRVSQEQRAENVRYERGRHHSLTATANVSAYPLKNHCPSISICLGVLGHPARSTPKEARVAGEVASLMPRLRGNAHELFLKEI